MIAHISNYFCWLQTASEPKRKKTHKTSKKCGVVVIPSSHVIKDWFKDTVLM